MTTKELTERYLSDTRALHTALENGVIDRFQHDSEVERLDERLFNDLDMLVIVTPTEQLERILQYS